jgi:hypothetical protein
MKITFTKAAGWWAAWITRRTGNGLASRHDQVAGRQAAPQGSLSAGRTAGSDFHCVGLPVVVPDELRKAGAV